MSERRFLTPGKKSSCGKKTGFVVVAVSDSQPIIFTFALTIIYIDSSQLNEVVARPLRERERERAIIRTERRVALMRHQSHRLLSPQDQMPIQINESHTH